MARYAVGIGARPGVQAAAVRALLDRVLVEHGLDPRGAVFATVAARADEPGLGEAVRAVADDTAGPETRVPDGATPGGVVPRGVVSGNPVPGDLASGGPSSGHPVPGGRVPGGVVAWQPDELATETVPNPSGRVADALGTPSVAEAAALRTARTFPGATGAELVVPKTVGRGVTAAVARPLFGEPR